MKEAKELREQNSTLTRRGQHQREEIGRLNKVSHDRAFLNRPREHKKVSISQSCVHSLQQQWHHCCFDVFAQALEEALRTTQPLEVSSETLQDIWKHQVSVVYHRIRPELDEKIHTLVPVDKNGQNMDKN